MSITLLHCVNYCDSTGKSRPDQMRSGLLSCSRLSYCLLRVCVILFVEGVCYMVFCQSCLLVGCIEQGGEKKGVALRVGHVVPFGRGFSLTD